MKIAIVNKFFFIKGGQETVALEQVKLLEEAGHEVAFFSMHHPKNPQGYQWSKYFVDHADFSLQDARVGLLKKQALALKFIMNKQASRRFHAFLEQFRPDIIHCHGIAHQLTYSILPVAKKHKIPVVQTLHDYQIICPNYTLRRGDNSICTMGCTTSDYTPCIKNRCVKNSLPASILSALEMTFNRRFCDYTAYVDKFISPSQFLTDKVISSGISAQKFNNIPNFLVNMDSIIPNYRNKGYFLYVGRLSYEKGLWTLLEAFKQLPKCKLLIAGDGPLNGQITNYCLEKGLTNIELLGHMDRDQIGSVLSDAMAVIVPSEWYENQPMTIIEAFANGKPVIAANIGGIPEMVIDGKNGFLFSPGDSQALAVHIQKASADESILEILGREAREYALEHYHHKAHLHKLLSLYASLL